MYKETLLTQLPAYCRQEELITADQDVRDIERAVLAKHVECEGDYDKIAKKFLGADEWETAENLFDFCKANLNYKVESKNRQVVSSPQTLLSRGHGDCKTYALFIAGCIDALERAGLLDCTWCYRFCSYNLFDPTPGHVFIVINPNGADTFWVDPVLDSLDERTPWPIWKRDRLPYGHAAIAKKIAGIGSVRRQPNAVGLSSAEQSILDSLLAYSQGVVSSVTAAQRTQTFNDVAGTIVKEAASVIPIPGLSAVVNIGVGALVKVLNGRTFESDQYWGAAFYYFYVLGQNITSAGQVSDAMVAPALQWFIDRTGVFISGRQHIMALIRGPQAYESYYGVNHYTTTDMSLVNKACVVAQTYWKLPTQNPPQDYAVFDPSLRGSWAQTVGVFDTQLAALAKQLGVSIEQANQAAEQGLITVPGITPGVSSIDPTTILIGAGVLAALAYFLTD
jgi:hypothetical protein